MIDPAIDSNHFMIFKPCHKITTDEFFKQFF